MSKELAERLDVESNPEAKERLKNLFDSAPTIPRDELDERIEKARNGEYVVIRVESWAELWENY